jgi:hypothetical protein
LFSLEYGENSGEFAGEGVEGEQFLPQRRGSAGGIFDGLALRRHSGSSSFLQSKIIVRLGRLIICK